MKESPIIFNDEMVRAILDGRKTQTRRLVESLPDWDWIGVARDRSKYLFTAKSPETGGTRSSAWMKCPYGDVGDRLWVRECFARAETWTPHEGGEYFDGEYVAYRATEPKANVERWRPSIHMPRWASRITLEITGVRVERLQEIGDSDCEAEGVRPSVDGDAKGWLPNETGWRRTYRQLWQSIYGVESWNGNPWVWVIEFRRFEQ